MITVTQVKRNAYLRQPYYQAKFPKPEVRFYAVWNKPIYDPNWNETRYMSNEGIRIHLVFEKDGSTYKELMKRYEQVYGEKFGKQPWMNAAEIIASILGKGDYYINPKEVDWHNDTARMKAGTASDFICTVYKASTFTPISLTKGEQAKLTAAQNLENRASFHALVAKDVLLTKLNESGFDIVVFNERYLNYNKVKGWNKLVKESIEYYLNNEILKDTGCKIKLPKIKNQHKYNYNDILCDLGDVELNLK